LALTLDRQLGHLPARDSFYERSLERYKEVLSRDRIGSPIARRIASELVARSIEHDLSDVIQLAADWQSCDVAEFRRAGNWLVPLLTVTGGGSFFQARRLIRMFFSIAILEVETSGLATEKDTGSSGTLLAGLPSIRALRVALDEVLQREDGSKKALERLRVVRSKSLY
jgi:hypothetical protein